MDAHQQAEATETNHKTAGVIMSYFKPLRRKSGLITLGLACALVVGWVRSITRADILEVWINALTAVSLGSVAGDIEAERYFDPDVGGLDVRGVADTVRYHSYLHPVPKDDLGEDFVWYLNRCGFRLGESYGDRPERFAVVIVPYFAIIVPLTLLSAWLLLSKPRAKKQPTREN